MEKPIIVGELFLETVNDKHNITKKGRIRKFQEVFSKVLNGDSDITILSSPPGSGKTKCFEYIFKQNKKALLIYPTNALIDDQYDRLSKRWSVKKLRAKDLEGKGKKRTSHLQAIIERYDIILTNPDIVTAINNKKYVNPSQDILRFFEKFQYIIYDEYHFYNAFEISGILLQIVLFLNMRYSKIILSSATPCEEIIKNIEDIKIIDTEKPIKITSIIEQGQKTRKSVTDHQIRHEVTVHCYDGGIYRNNLEDVITILRRYSNLIKSEQIKIMFIFTSVRDANSFYNTIFDEFDGYVEIDTGYETRADVIIHEKAIFITTAKGEVGLNPNIDFLFMEEGYSHKSFIQRITRIGRHKPGICYIFTRKKVSLEGKIEYPVFLDYFSNLIIDPILKQKPITTLFNLRCYSIIQTFDKHKEKLNLVLKDVQFKKYNKFFTIYNNQMKQIEEYIGKSFRYCIIKVFFDELLEILKSLRGNTTQKQTIYNRGNEKVDTQYDILHFFTWYHMEIKKDGSKIKFEQGRRSEEPLIKTLIYDFGYGNIKPVSYSLFDEQIKNTLERKWKEILNRFMLDDNDKKFLDYCFKEIISAFYELKYFKNMLPPQRVILKDGKDVDICNNQMMEVTQDNNNTII